jgi:cathepsin D
LPSDALQGPVKRQNSNILTAVPPAASDTAPLNHDAYENSYLVNVKIGSNAQPLTLLIDTGAPYTWIMGLDCTANACLARQRFNREASTSFRTLSNQNLNVTYGSGQISGYFANDVFQIAGFNVTVNFGYATNVSNSFTTFPFDGILGLSRNDHDDPSSSIAIDTFMDTLVTSGTIENKEIGIELARDSDIVNNGEITFGGTDPAMYDGAISWNPAVAPVGRWVIDVDNFSINGASLNFGNRTTVLDTGSSYLLLPSKDLDVVLGQFPTLSVLQSGDPILANGYDYALPCTTQLVMTFTFNGLGYDVAPSDYLDFKSQNGTYCGFRVALLGDLGDSNGNTVWYTGTTFLKTVYSVFDFDGARIGMEI